MGRVPFGLLIAAALIGGCSSISSHDVIGEHRGMFAPGGGPGRAVTLILNDDLTAAFHTEQVANVPTIIETGTWKLGSGKMVHVKLRKQGDRPTVNDLTFELREGSLVAVEYDRERYGREGLTLRPTGW
ncbi:hypothetical protein KKH27_04090 [bacterium]|nr:hypothetical protein [bacterium]MBU1983089.1 hypothetical protein [bacterium]